MEPTPGEPWVEEDARLALVGLGCSSLLVVAALAVGAYFLFVGKKVDVPNVVGRDASEAADILHQRGLEVAFVNQEYDKVPRDEVISQDPEAGDEVREGTTVTVKVSGGKGTVGGARRRGPVAGGRRAGAAATPASRPRSRRRSRTPCPRAT